MSKVCNGNIRRALEMAYQLGTLADEGETSSVDDGCAVIYCVMRDCSYKIRAQAERERDLHRRLGLWDRSGKAE